MEYIFLDKKFNDYIAQKQSYEVKFTIQNLQSR